MTPLEMIFEWRRGCSCADVGRPEECHECTAALIHALERALRWKPIEEAPMDGTEILVGVDIATVWITRNARYVRADEWCPPDEEEEDTDGWWAYENSVAQEQLTGIYKPTHYLSIPEKPRLMKSRKVGQFYIWQVETYGQPELRADLPAEIWLYRPMPCTPSGDHIADVISAFEADQVLDKLEGMCASEARAHLRGRVGFRVLKEKSWA